MVPIIWVEVKRFGFFSKSIRMTSHLPKDPLTDDSKEQWLEEDAHLFLQIFNSIDSKVLGFINHCEFVKALMNVFHVFWNGECFSYI